MSVNPSNTNEDAETLLNKNPVRAPLHILVGDEATLGPLWKAYYIVAQPGTDGDVQHTMGLYVSDAQGREREWVEGGYDPHWLSADTEALSHEGS